MRIILLFLFAFVLSADCFAQVNVKGYYRKDGTYVAPHIRSSPDSYKWNNYGPSSSSPEYRGKGHVTSPYTRDIDRDGIANLLDLDDNNDGIHDDAVNHGGLQQNLKKNSYQYEQPIVTSNGFEKIPALVTQLLLSDSTAYGLYHTSQNEPIKFTEHLYANGTTTLVNAQGNTKSQSNGIWGIQGENICFKYTSQNTVCYDFRLMPEGIGVFDISKNGKLDATIAKIENSEFLFDFENGTGLTPEKLNETKALLERMKKFQAK